MYWLRLTGRQKKLSGRMRSMTQTQDPFADQRESLYWTALMITGDTELAERSIIQATRLAVTSSRDFRDWLVLWAHLATARTALNTVRSSIQETAKSYADWTCSHHSHEPLSLAETRVLQELDTNLAIQQLDPLARAVLVLRGCHGAFFEDCMFLLDVPVQSAVGAFCTAVEWYKQRIKDGDKVRMVQLWEPAFSLSRARWILGLQRRLG
jgi:DNA-directed RNA polymerase specialized sigma24 family protein